MRMTLGLTGIVIALIIAGCGSAPRSSTSQAGTPPTGADPSSEISAPSLRFDGLYVVQHPTNPRYKHFLRLYPNGSSAWAVSSGDTQQVARWLDRLHPQCHRGPWRTVDGMIAIRLHPPGTDAQRDGWADTSDSTTITGSIHRDRLQVQLAQPGHATSRELVYLFEEAELVN